MTQSILFISRLPIWMLDGKSGAPSFYETLKGYVKQDWQVFFITLSRDNQPTPDDPYLNKIHFTYLNIPLYTISSALPWYLKIARKFLAVIVFPLAAIVKGWKILKDNKVDIVYGYETHGILAAWALSRVFRKPSVSRFQGTILAPYISPMRVIPLLKKIEHLLSFWFSAHLYIMTNDGTQGDLVLNYLNPKAFPRLRFWRNGVDKLTVRPYPPSRLSMLRASLGMADNDIILMSLSRLERWKRIDRILRALPNVVTLEPRVRLLVIGDGTPDEKENLVNLARQLGIESSVQFVGRVSHDKVADYLNVADIFLSMYDLSNVGNPLLEAMSCGKCVITLNNGDTGQLIKNEENGILLEIDQLEKLPESILRLVHSPELRQRLGHNALQFAQVKFWTWDQRMQTEIDEVSKLLLIKKVG